jgi:cobalt-zinc-cadmium efflux system protein
MGEVGKVRATDSENSYFSYCKLLCPDVELKDDDHAIDFICFSSITNFEMNSHNHHNHHLNAALILTAIFAVVELLGGWMANSLALLSDAAHMVSDVVALALAAIAGRVALRPAHAEMTYGYGRARVLAALANGLGLWFLSGWIFWEATGRLANPPEVTGELVLVIAAIGLIINIVILKWLHGSHDLNTRAAYMHVIGDALGSVAAIVAGLVIIFTGWMPIDPILSFLVAAILAWGGWRLLRETIRELMEAVPEGVDSRTIEKLMQEVEGVSGIHHVHLWKLPDGQLAISSHVQLEQMDEWPDILSGLQQILELHGINHSTLQPEIDCSEIGGCC